jgi:hypothetical protein
MNKFNPEHYYDPTAYEALSNKYIPLVYVASPYSGDVAHNTSLARRYCRFVLNKGCAPLAPHLHYPQFMEDTDPAQRDSGIRFALILLGKCDELWCFGTPSKGMRREIARAKRRNMTIRRFNDKCEEMK